MKVTSAGQTVQAEPGTAVEVRPRQGSGDAIAVGAAAPSLDQMKQEVRALRERLDAAERTLAAQQTQPAQPPSQPPAQPPSQPSPTAPPPARPPADTLDRAAIEKGLRPVRFAIAACDDGSYRGTITAMATVAPDGGVNGVVLQPARTAINGCVELALRAARFDATRRGGVLRESFRFTAAPRPAPARSCDADALADQGKEHYARGSLAAALASFEQAYACRADPAYAEKAFIAACNLPLVAKAALFYRRMTPQSRARALMICVRNGITEEMLEGASTRSGKLQVSSASPARVFVDGKSVGDTPIVVELPPGRHVVKLQIGTASEVHTVEVKSGETVMVDRTLGAP